MSSSSLKAGKRPSHSKRPSNAAFKNCDYGTDHVNREELEDLERDFERHRAGRKRELQEKEDDLTKCHNELAEAQQKHETLQKELRELGEAKRKVEEDLKRSEGDLGRWKEALDKANSNIRIANDRKERVEENNATLRREIAEEKARSLILGKRPTEEDLESERGKVAKLEREVKTLSAKFDNQAKARDLAKDLLEQNRADLTPILALHPALAKLDNPTTTQIAETLVQNIVFDLNEIWNHLPTPSEEALVTPSTTTLVPLLQKLRRSVTLDLQRDQELEKKWKQAELRYAENKRTLDGFYSLVKWVGLGTDVSLEQVKQYIDDLKRRAGEAAGLKDQLALQKAGFKAAGEEVVGKLQEQLKGQERELSRLNDEVSNLRHEKFGLENELASAQLTDDQTSRLNEALRLLQQVVYRLL